MNRKTRNYRIAGTLFSLAGLLWVLKGFVSGNNGLNIPIGMMNVCIGMIILSMARREEKTQVSNTQKEEIPINEANRNSSVGPVA